ncbi:MAG: DUF4340 domain-containing protein [Planctomycetaceae bacterium]|nr:DUF4340 domain-containing protein [Planctomycetaceae bacterium]
MNEITKTSIYIATAIVLLLFVWLIQPRSGSVLTDEMVGRELLENFKDPQAIRGLEIVKYVAETGDVIRFQVAEAGGKWVIPSHQNYPADAKDQMGLVASGFIDQKVLDVAYKDTGKTDVRETHAMYGVMDPTSKNIVQGTDAGIKVTFTGENNKILASLIIGKAVEGSNDTHYYVRIPDQNTVYTMAVSPDHLSTKFDDWIEKNLLGLNSFDLHSVQIQDYSTDLALSNKGVINHLTFHSNMNIAYDAKAAGEKWSLAAYTKEDPKTHEPLHKTLAPNETLDTKKLDEMRQAFDDLKIIDVLRKPENIASAMKEGKSPVTGSADIEVLESVGFVLQPIENDDRSVSYMLLSKQGEVGIEMNDGLVYQLRFGNLTGTTLAGENAKKNDTAGDAAKNDASKNGDAVASDESKPKPETAADILSANRYLMIVVTFDESLIEKPKFLTLADIPTEGDPAEIERLKAKRDADERENKRLEDEYRQTIESGKKRAKELNARFADWFYVISDDVFKKVHRSDMELIRDLNQPVSPDGTNGAGLQTPRDLDEMSNMINGFKAPDQQKQQQPAPANGEQPRESVPETALPAESAVTQVPQSQPQEPAAPPVQENPSPE